ncbi:MAG: hypothetical protein ACKVRP_09360 [Bacteroidota bacterium]
MRISLVVLATVLVASSMMGADLNMFPDTVMTAKSSQGISVSGGMGVSYVSAPDIVDFVNAFSGERVPEFKSAIEFFGAIKFPLSPRWILKLEYAYMLGTYNVSNSGEFTFVGHLPSLIGQYVLVGEETYNVKIGAGLGCHVGILSAKDLTLVDDYSGKGIGTKLEVEANTAISESFFAYLGGDIRWDFIGQLTNDAGNAPPSPRTATVPTLHFFSVGAKLGFTFYF